MRAILSFFGCVNEGFKFVGIGAAVRNCTDRGLECCFAKRDEEALTAVAEADGAAPRTTANPLQQVQVI